MKRWGWGILLALPWTVYSSSFTHENGHDVMFIWAKHTVDGQEPTAVECGQNADSCQDFVDAMNTAHAQRGYTKPILERPKEKKEKPKKLPKLELKKGG